MRHAPEDDGEDRDHADEPLYTREFVLHGPYGHDGSAFSGLKGDQEESPDEQDRDYANR